MLIYQTSRTLCHVQVVCQSGSTFSQKRSGCSCQTRSVSTLPGTSEIEGKHWLLRLTPPSTNTPSSSPSSSVEISTGCPRAIRVIYDVPLIVYGRRGIIDHYAPQVITTLLLLRHGMRHLQHEGSGIEERGSCYGAVHLLGHQAINCGVGESTANADAYF